MWRSVGFLISFAVVLEGMTFVAFVVILAGGKQMRETGWKMLTVFLVLIGLVQAGGMGLVVSPCAPTHLFYICAYLYLPQGKARPDDAC